MFFFFISGIFYFMYDTCMWNNMHVCTGSSCHQDKFLVGVNTLGNKVLYDSDFLAWYHIIKYLQWSILYSIQYTTITASKHEERWVHRLFCWNWHMMNTLREPSIRVPQLFILKSGWEVDLNATVAIQDCRWGLKIITLKDVLESLQLLSLGEWM